MNESVFREILGESLRREFAEFDNAPEHKFSLDTAYGLVFPDSRHYRGADRLAKSEVRFPEYEDVLG